jgi:two-component system OmpR family sensor kinase
MGRPWSLQRRLVVASVALLAVVSAVVGAVSVVALRENLIQRLDQQVNAELRFVEDVLTGNPGQPGDPNGTRTSVRMVVADGDVVFGEYVDEDRESVPLTTRQRQQLLAGARGQRPTTVALDGLGEFRVAMQQRGDVSWTVGLSTEEVDETTANLVLIFVLVAMVALAVAAIAGAVVVRVALRPLERVAATATRVSELPLDKGEVALAERVDEADTDPRTEVGQVGAAFNRMLGHVEDALVSRQRSEDRVRQFVADASHELRTPLASIRGYSELTRRGGHRLPEDVTRALGRIESESVRMTSLVEDLLLLARLDAGRELVLSEVDLVPLAIDAVQDAHAASPEHEWSLDAPESPVIVMGDGGRLHQVLANLLANARVHTPSGTQVDTVLRAEHGFAVLTVQDDGPGISAELQAVLFERFARGDGSRARKTGSTGLGLAIVAAVVDGHGGSVSVGSEPGRTVFTVRLPLASH